LPCSALEIQTVDLRHAIKGNHSNLFELMVAEPQALIPLGGLILYMIERFRTLFTLYFCLLNKNELINFQNFFFALFICV
jgi:hypothetical protein